MSANQAVFPVSTMARVLGVSRAGLYAWLRHPVSAHVQAAAALLKRIRTVHATSRETYGAPRVHAELRARGERYGRKRVARLMRDADLVDASRRRHGPITTRRDKEARPAPDLVDRDFTAAGPYRLWVADISFVPTSAGFLYLAVVLDAWSRKIVGWLMANHLRAELVTDALDMRSVSDALTAVSSSIAIRGRSLPRSSASCSTAAVSQAEARVACFSFIERWYNPVRLHSALGYSSPIRYEQDMQTKLLPTKH